MKSKTTRLDIQILRAYAVLLVLAYHAGAESFQNGFLGVDIFFVISGYLMAKIFSKGSTAEFYKSRIKRLAPSFLLVIWVFVLIGLLRFPPFQFKELVIESITGLGGFANVYFWGDDAYFAPERFRPYLHLWTLAVEIQFYLLFPILQGISKKLKHFWPIICVGSFAVSQLLLLKSTKSAFFLLPGRLWEFALGVIAATYFTTPNKRYRVSRSMRITLMAIGLLAPLAMSIDPNSNKGITGHPGLAAAVVALGAFMLVSTPIELKDRGKRLFSLLILIGNASYVIYLVHFPLFVFANFVPFGASKTNFDSLPDKFIWVTLSVCAGIAIWKYFERPILEKSFSMYKLVAIAIGSLILLLALVPINSSLNPKTMRNISSSLEDRSVYRCGKMFRISHPFSRVCEINASRKVTSRKVLLLGNSHADMVKGEFIRIAQKYDYSLFFWADNNPFTNSDESIKLIVSEIKALNIDFVILHSSYLYPSAREVGELANRLSRSNIQIIMLESVPTYMDSVPILEYKKTSAATVDSHNELNPESIGVRETYSDLHQTNFTYFTSQRFFCKPKCKWGDSESHLFYFDSNHLTLLGARQLRPVVEQIASYIEALAKKG